RELPDRRESCQSGRRNRAQFSGSLRRLELSCTFTQSGRSGSTADRSQPSVVYKSEPWRLEPGSLQIAALPLPPLTSGHCSQGPEASARELSQPLYADVPHPRLG